MEKEIKGRDQADLFEISNKSIRKFSRLIGIKTVSYRNYESIDKREYKKFELFLKNEFPLIHKNLKRKKINEFGYLYTWKGADPKLKPILISAHFDVVPADEGTEKNWTHPPFSGRVDDKFIWGRGTQDMKLVLISILESAELLIKQNFKPQRTIYFAFGGDEEVDGKLGAAQISAYLEKNGVELEYILDEGAVIADGVLPSIKKPVALIGIAEKGHLNVELVVKCEGGHASMPPRKTAVGILSSAIHRLERNPFPLRLTYSMKNFFKHIAPYMSAPLRFVLKNHWLFGKIIKIIFSRKPNTDALVRSTIAATVIEGSSKENVLPDYARAVINVRILPGKTIDDILKRIRKVIKNSDIEVRILGNWTPNEPVAESRIDSQGYQDIKETINKVAPWAIIAPFLVAGSTDSKNYRNLTKSIFRFSPMRLDSEDIKGIHGVNERISRENYKLSINFFFNLFKISAA